MERETGIEPATNSLEGCDSTTELLPPFDSLRSLRASLRSTSLAQGKPSIHFARSGQAFDPLRSLRASLRSTDSRRFSTPLRACHERALSVAQGESNGGQGRIRTSVATGAADLQSAAIDRSATCPRRAATTAHCPARVRSSTRHLQPTLGPIHGMAPGQLSWICSS
jgi:hypothetical protein